MLTNLDEVFKPPSAAPAPVEKRKVVLHMDNVEAAAQAEKERLMALMASKEEAATAAEAPSPSAEGLKDTTEQPQAGPEGEEAVSPGEADKPSEPPAAQPEASQPEASEPFIFCSLEEMSEVPLPSSVPVPAANEQYCTSSRASRHS